MADQTLPKFKPGDRVLTIKEAPYYDTGGNQAGTERLAGTINGHKPLPDGTYLYYMESDKHGIIPEREDQIELLIGE